MHHLPGSIRSGSLEKNSCGGPGKNRCLVREQVRGGGKAPTRGIPAQSLEAHRKCFFLHARGDPSPDRSAGAGGVLRFSLQLQGPCFEVRGQETVECLPRLPLQIDQFGLRQGARQAYHEGRGQGLGAHSQ